MKYLLSLILASLFLFSCERTPTTRVEGTVLEEGTLKPIANAEVLIYISYSKGLFQGIDEWPIDTVYTDSEGKFVWESKLNPNSDLYESEGNFKVYKIEHKDYFHLVKSSISKQGNQTTLNYTEKTAIEVFMQPHSYLNLKLVNSEVPPTNYCRFGLVDAKVLEELFDGDLNMTYEIPGNKMILYKYTTDINLNEWVIDSFYLNAFETKTLEFTY